MDLKITQARLPQQSGLWDIGIVKGRIAQVDATLSESAVRTIEADGQLLIPGLVDAHFHLDKAFLLDRCTAVAGDFGEAMRETLHAKQNFTVADIQTRASRSIEAAIAFGITAMRSHVEVDPTIGLRAIEALLPLRERYAWGLTLQLAVFAQEGITNHPGSIELLRQALQMGGDLIGSAPYADPDPAANIRMIFDLAAEFDCDVDFHLDFLDDDAPLSLPLVIAETQQRGWQGRVCLGHMTKLAKLPPAELNAMATDLAAAGSSILALPASDLYMMSRRDTHNVRRGVAPIHTLAAQGVNVGLATNNVQNLFTPFGDGDVLKICTLLAQVLQLGTVQAQQQCLDMATVQAARAIGLSDYGLAPGCQADLVLIAAGSVGEAIAAAPPSRTVIKGGRVVAQSKLERWLATA